MTTVYKFGGASIKDVNRIKNINSILDKYDEGRLVIVFSAIGKVTNMLESLVDLYFNKHTDYILEFNKLKDLHYNIANKLFKNDHHVFDEINNIFIEMEWILEEEPVKTYSFIYDQIVSFGEHLSCKIMSEYLNANGFLNEFIDARDMICTDDSFRNAKIDWKKTTESIKRNISNYHCVTQGFIGVNSENYTTTLGREGSDFTAAILGYVLNANKVVIWKDVPGMMNADPKYFPDAKLLSNLSFDEAIELAFFGAKVIHPKTLQPLKKKNIALRIKSFLDLDNEGTLINSDIINSSKKACYIIKDNQILISISDVNLSFIIEDHMSEIFLLLSKHALSVNMMQNSAVSFSICIDNDKYKAPNLINDLKKRFKVFYNEDLTLYTIRNYTKDLEKELVKNKKVFLEQKSRNNLQIVARMEEN